MAIAKTGAIYKALNFDGKSSRTYGVYITGEAVYNAPEREVEMIAIPGRNGAFALDRGRFENITVTYPAGIFADNEADFAEAISNFRNYLCSRSGYCRLTDEYNPDEYRLAVYKNGLEVSPALLRAGEFEITFECKPQRFLTSGETAVSVVSGGTLTNPTLFPSSPLIEATGYGTIDINGAQIVVDNVPIGLTQVVGSLSSNVFPYTFTFNDEYANPGDLLTMKGLKRTGIYFTINYGAGYSGYASFDSATATNGGNYAPDGVTSQGFTLDNLSFTYGTSSTKTSVATVLISTANYGVLTVTITISIAYNGSNSFTFSTSQTVPVQLSIINGRMELEWVKLDSTQSALGNPMYIDLDIGEAYKIENGSAISVNDAVSIPAELPTVAAGSNTITYDNTFTNFKILPRWWKV